MTRPSLDDLDLVSAVFEHRLRQPELEGVLNTLSKGGSKDLLGKVGDVLRQISALHEVGHKMSESLSLDVLLPRLMDIVTSTLGAERSTLFLYDDETDELYSRVAQGEGVDEIRLAAGEGVAGSVFSSGLGVCISDPYADPRFQPDVDRRSGFRTRNLLCAPVRHKGKAVGVIEVLNKHEGEFDRDDLRFLDVLTTQAAAGLENARLYERVNSARRTEKDLLELTGDVASELILNTLLAKTITTVTEMLQADRSTLFLYDRTTDELWSRVAEGMEKREIRVSARAGISGASFSAGEVINVDNAYEDARFHRDVDKETGYVTRSVLAMPVINKQGRKLGVIQVLNKQRGSFAAIDEQRLKAYSNQVATALENAQLFEDALTERTGGESSSRSSSNGIVTLNAEGQLVKVNEAALDTLRWDLRSVLGRPLAELFHHPANRWVVSTVGKAVESGEIEVVTDAELELGGGSSASVNFTVVPLLHVDNGPIGHLLVFEDITAEKCVKGAMARYVTEGVADRFLAREHGVAKGVTAAATVLYCDIRDFDGVARRLGASETIAMLNDYSSDMIEVIFGHGGTLDNHVGNALMALFGSPFPSVDDAHSALRAANEMLRALKQFNAERRSSGNPAIDVGVGISTGEYTVHGNSVGVAAQLQAASTYYGAKILFSEFTAEALGRYSAYREIDIVRVRGKRDPVVIYESLDHFDDDFPNMSATRKAYDKGIKRYFNADWRGAAFAFEEALSHRRGDGPSKLYLYRCRRFLQSPPPPDWDGVWPLPGP